VLRRGAVVAFPTETYYGLGVDALADRALRRLHDAKGRIEGRGIPVLVADAAMLELLVAEVPEAARALIARYWPGPLTLVLPARPGLPRALLGPEGHVGVRRSSHPWAQALVRAFGRPLTATSANLSGQAPARSAEEVRRSLGSRLGHVLDGGTAPGKAASTVVQVDGGGMRLLRPGPIEIDGLGRGDPP
jgi:L-threonylcarbamoyladenylate synthase